MKNIEKILAKMDENEDIREMDVEEFLKLPRERRFKWGFWYKVPYALESGQWKVWKKYIKSNFPVQSFLREEVYWWFRMPWFRIKDKFYYLKCLFWKRYHILKLRDYPGYNDPSSEILQAIEKVLERFYQEDPWNFIDWENSGEGHIKAKEAIQRAYNWFKVDKVNRQKVVDDLIHELYGKKDDDEDFLDRLNRPETPERKEKQEKLWKLEDETEKEETEILVALIQHRGYLWT